MNCKQDDLARVVRSKHGNLGKIVRCVRFVPVFQLDSADGPSRVVEGGWEIDPALPSFNSTKCSICMDENLRPIRDPGEDATDETLEWLPVPIREHA